MSTRVKANIGSGFAVFCSQLLAEVSSITIIIMALIMMVMVLSSIIIFDVIIIIMVLIMMMMRMNTVKLCRISLAELHPILLLLHVNAGFTKRGFYNRGRDRMIVMMIVDYEKSCMTAVMMMMMMAQKL